MPGVNNSLLGLIQGLTLLKLTARQGLMVATNCQHHFCKINRHEHRFACFNHQGGNHELYEQVLPCQLPCTATWDRGNATLPRH